jgi:hypothetical protein
MEITVNQIQLSDNDKKWIKLCKLHYADKYPSTGEWTNTLKPLFIEIYGYNPDEDDNYHDYLNCIFNKLFDVYNKIKEEGHSERELKELFEAAFYERFHINQELPIERTIARLCGLIQINTFRDKEGNERYNLDIK